MSRPELAGKIRSPATGHRSRFSVEPAPLAGLARVGLAALSGALYMLGYQPFAQSAVGWFALAPLLIALRGAGTGAAIGLGWLTGTITCLGVAGYWIWSAASAYF